MFRSLGGALLVCGLVVALLTAVAARPAARPAGPSVAPTAPTTEATTTTTIAAPTSTAAPTTTAPSSTTSTTTTSTTTSTSTTTTIITTSHDPPVRVLPAASVVASNSVVGLGGTIVFDGTCATDGYGTVVARIGSTSTTALVDTGLSGTAWSYTWTAPTDLLLISSFDFEFWCGDPGDAPGAYPGALRRRVDMVASELPAPTQSPPPSPAADRGAATTATLPPTR